VAKSKYLAKKLLDHTLGVQAYAMPAAVYLALFTGGDGLEGGSLAAELSAGGYARVAVHMAAAADTADGAQSLGAQNVQFEPATADWPIAQAWALVDAQTGGNVLHYGAMPQYGDPPAYKRVYAGDTFFVSSANLAISEE
jgi:hypothetical protein